MDFCAVDIQTIEADWLSENQVSLDVLRLDKIHPVIGGNKWFKLKYYLEDAKASHKNTVATFGGAWSNHIVAAACACKDAGLKSVGIIRGERPTELSTTLSTAASYGMDFIFVSREEYRHKQLLVKKHGNKDWYWIAEGGYGSLGIKGASEIYTPRDLTQYTHIVAGVGTGTMLAGIISSALPEQKIIGISALKGNMSLEQEIKFLLGDQVQNSFTIYHDYHFGGFGKHPQILIDFMNNMYLKHQLPLDIVYTGKTFFAIKDLVEKGQFERGSKIVMIHSGGLQGNSSLGEKLLAY